MEANYGSFESFPTRYSDHEAWVYIDNTWKEFPPGEVRMSTRPMTKKEFTKNFGQLPAMPKAAFQAGE